MQLSENDRGEGGGRVMANTDITKSAIAASMKQLMQKIPFDHITIADIIKKCGISRKTFYYHFKDKYDLINWIFSTEIIDQIVENTTLDNLEQCNLQLCHYVRDNKVFCANAINESGQNSLIQFLYSYVERQINILCREAVSQKILSGDDVKFLIDYYYNAFTGVLKTWIKDDLKDSPETIVKRWMSVVNQNLENYISMIQGNSSHKKVIKSSECVNKQQ